MRMYIANVDEHTQEFKSTRKSEIKKFALQALKDGAEVVAIYYGDYAHYIGSFYADGEMPRIFTK